MVVQTVTVKDQPPAELLRCPVAVRGLPESGGAVIPADWRAGIQRLALALSGRTDQLIRLLTWHGVTCEEN